MIDTPEAALAEIAKLNLPPVFTAIMSGKLADDPEVPAYAKWEFRRPHTYFEHCLDLPKIVRRLKGLCPLWETNGDTIVGVLPGGEFVSFFYEDAGEENPNDEVRMLGRNYQQFITTILVGIEEADLWDSYAERISRLFHYRHLDELRAILDAWTEETGDEELDRFRNSLQGA